MNTENIDIINIPIADLKASEYNPRKHTKEQKEQLKLSIQKYGCVEPLVANSAPERKDILIGGHFRLECLKELGYTEAPVVYVRILDIEKEKELNVRLNKNTGEFDFELLAKFDEGFLKGVGFSSEEIDEIFPVEENHELFNLEKELAKLDIKDITVQKGDVYELDGSKLMCGDSTVEADVLKLMNGEKADACCTDEPYLLDYNSGKRKEGSTEGFGMKKNRVYLGTETLPENFVDLWMSNIQKVAKPDFSILSYECWKNLPVMWSEIAKRWKVRNLIIWHLPNRVQGFAAKYRFFNKYDFAMVGSSPGFKLNDEPEEDELLQNEYETAIFATSGKPHWESYEAGKKICPTDFVTFKAADEKSSGQGIVFGTKPLEILIPYIKVLTKRGDLIVEPFGGSGSTLIASIKMGRRCFLMEKCPTYAQVILRRWEKATGKKPVKIA